jgi:hypothetical protein
MAVYRIPVHPEHLRSITDPNDSEIRTLYALINVFDLPQDLSLSPDPRMPKECKVTQRIAESLGRWNGRFHILNRGIVITAQSAEYDNVARVLRLDIPDDEDYGILDGGHTKLSIASVTGRRERESEGETPQYVRLEILLGVKGFLGDVASARNFSENVKAMTLADYEKKLDWLKQAVGVFGRQVRWRENATGKMDAQELIQILTAMNTQLFSATDHPLEAYKNSGKCLEYITADGDTYGYRKLAEVAVDIWRLYDVIRDRWWHLYREPDPDTGKRGRPGRVEEVTARKRGHASLMHYVTLGKDGDPKKDKHVEKGLAFPVLAGFRHLLGQGDNGPCQWVEDPVAFFQRHGRVLVRRIMELSDQRQNNPHTVGRDPNVYQQMYELVELLRLREQKDQEEGRSKPVRRRTRSGA